jgi:LacI family transcriptional regulator
MEAVRELKYQPNVLAQGLNGVRLKSLGISFQTPYHGSIITGHYRSSLLRGIIDASYEAGYNVTVFHRPWNGASESAAGFRSQGIDGFLIIAPLAGSDMVTALSNIGIPLVVVSSSSDEHDVPSVDVDNRHGVSAVLDHLFDLGHRRIAHISLDGGFANYDSIIRRETFVRIMGESECPARPEYLRSVTREYNPETDAAVRELMALPEPPTAIFATNDTLALRVILSLNELGIDVPGRVSVVGFDDIPDAARVDPQLTTVRQPLIEIGAEATRLLIAILDGREAIATTRWFEPELVVRKSTAAAHK